MPIITDARAAPQSLRTTPAIDAAKAEAEQQADMQRRLQAAQARVDSLARVMVSAGTPPEVVAHAMAQAARRLLG